MWPHYFPLHHKPSYSLSAYDMSAGIVVHISRLQRVSIYAIVMHDIACPLETANLKQA